MSELRRFMLRLVHTLCSALFLAVHSVYTCSAVCTAMYSYLAPGWPQYCLIQNFNSLHQNLEWEFNHGKEGAYLDLWVMIKDGKIQTKIFTKSEPVYVGPTSCHDPKVFKSIFKGVGLRLRLNCSNDEDFDSAVDL